MYTRYIDYSNNIKRRMINKRLFQLVFLGFLILFVVQNVEAIVMQRDSTLNWQHHRYSLNSDYSMASMTTVDNDIITQQFHGKVIENELFRIVLVPEYGGRIISYFYKPTAHEYLYQSPCGTPYGISQGNFYYNWLMVYGGIFPTFPEPEHGKTWLKPWQYAVVKATADTVMVRMSMTDNTEYSGHPGQFNNGITGIVCDAEVGVYSGQAGFSFNVKLTNPSVQSKKYEYWTCTTLTPGSDLGKTFTPVNSEIVAPMTKYEAAWSTNNWIGKFGSFYDFSTINMLSEWTEMGIAYATTRTDDYWGVINHVNEEGFFRIADRNITKGMKLWTWGKNAVNANKFSVANGGEDDYIELWGGTVMHFFDDAISNPNSQLTWSEYFFPTVSLTGVTAMNNQGGAFIDLNTNTGTNNFDLKLNYFLTQKNQNYLVDLYLNQDNLNPVFSENFKSISLGNSIVKSINSSSFIDGTNTLKANLKNDKGEIVLTAQKQFNIPKTDILNPMDRFDNVRIECQSKNRIQFNVLDGFIGEVSIYNLEGKVIYNGNLVNGKQIELQNSGIYIIRMVFDNKTITRKIVLY